MKRVLVTYATMAGSTAEVAQEIAAELGASGLQAEVLPLDAVQTLQEYDAVVVGAPMIMGWHRGALRFLRKQRGELKDMPYAVFVTAMSLTETGEREVEGVAVTVDEKLPKAPANAQNLSFRERYARLSNYLRPILRAGGTAKPASIGVFGGRMEYGRLKWWAVLFAMFIVRAPAGERRNWDAIRAWAASLPQTLQLENVAPVVSRRIPMAES